MRRTSRWFTLAALLAGSPLAAGAQASSPAAPGSRGFATAIGIGKGSASLVCAFCAGDGLGSFAGTLGATAPLRRGVRWGVEANWWLHGSGGVRRSIVGAAPLLQLYPSGGGRLFLKLGLGFGRFQASSDEEELRAESLVGLVGAGYELRLADHAIVPYWTLLRGSGGSMRLNGVLVPGAGGLSLLQYGVAIGSRQVPPAHPEP